MPPHRPRVANEPVTLEPNHDLFSAIRNALGTESKFLQRAGPRERRLVPVWAAYGPRPPASPAALNVKGETG